MPTHLQRIISTAAAPVDLDSRMFVHAEQVCERHSPEQLKKLMDLELRNGRVQDPAVLLRDHQTSQSSAFNELRSGSVQGDKLKKCLQKWCSTECSSNSLAQSGPGIPVAV